MFKKLIIFLLGSDIDCSKQNPIEYDILLRAAGQSLDEHIDEIYNKIQKKLILHLGILFGIIMSIILFKLSNYLYIVVFIFYLYILWSIVKYIPKIRNYKLGRDGERSVAQYLYIIARQLSKEDANMHIYHDLVDEKKAFNIDHVVVSKKGIFIFETKTYRKSKGITNTITSNGEELFKNGQKMTNNIPLQISSQVKWLQSELLQNTGKKYEIIPTVAFVGWYVEGNKIDGIHITTAKTIRNIIENQYRDILYSDEELKRITSVIHKLSIVTNENHFDICK